MKQPAATRLTAIFAALVLLTSGCAGGVRDVTTVARSDTIAVEVREGTRLAFDLSPDGRTIVFDLLGQLWTLPAEGGEARALTNAVRDTAEDRRPAFSPDGRSIVFASDRPGHESGLWVVPVTGGAPRLLPGTADAGTNITPAWRPQGDRIAFVSAGGIQLWDVAEQRVTAVPVDTSFSGNILDLGWTPDGERLVFASDGRLWEVPWRGGGPVPLTSPEVQARAPSVAPDGRRIAFVSRGPADGTQLWVRGRSGGDPLRLADHADLRPVTARWSADGRTLFYVADGGLWRVATDGGSPEAIPFRARLTLPRTRADLPPVRFPAPGMTRPATGHAGLALSPDGTTIAIFALGHLWTMPVGGTPRAVSAVPRTAAGLAWSPDGTEIAWSAGTAGTQDIFVTDVLAGTTRRLTDVPGQANRPSWSPDGRHIAFLHWEKPELPTPPWFRGDGRTIVRIVPAMAVSATVEETRELGQSPSGWFLILRQETPQWTPDSRSLLGFTVARGAGGRGAVRSLGGEQHELPRFPENPTFVQLGHAGTIHYIKENRLWRSAFSADSGIYGETVALTETASLYPSVSRDGSVLYLGPDGLRLRRAGGDTRHLGWPLEYRTPEAPTALLIRNVRIIDGTGRPATAPSDMLIAGGRIAAIAPQGELPAVRDARMLDGGGRFVIPGLIDAHVHVYGVYGTATHDEMLRGMLYHGITTVRDKGSPIAHLAALRDAIEAGIMTGPRIVPGGFQFYPMAAGGHGLSAAVTQAPTDEATTERGIALAAGFGARYVKMRESYSLATGVSVIRHAHAAGMPVSSHVAGALPFVAAGIDGQEHAPGGYDDVTALFRAAGIWVVPTIIAFSHALWTAADSTLTEAPGHVEFVSPAMRWAVSSNPANAERWQRSAAVARANTRKLHEAGVLLAAGTDVDLPWTLHWELEELVGAGLSPMEALMAATGNAARVLGAQQEIGTVEVGKLADLVILDADPLHDIRNTQRIWMVIQGGRVVDREALREAEAQELRRAQDPAAREFRRIAESRGSAPDAERLRALFATMGQAMPGRFVADTVVYPSGERATFHSLSSPARTERWESALAALESFDRDGLTAQDALAWAIVRSMAARELARAAAPPGPVPPAHWPDRVIWFYSSEYLQPQSVADYEALLAELRGVPHQIDELLERMESGLVPPAVLMAGVADTLRAVIVDSPMESGYLVRFAAFPDAIPPDERQRLRASAETIYATRIRPAYERLLARVVEHGGTEAIGLSALPGGAERYDVLVRSWEGASGPSPADVHHRARAEVARYGLAIDSLRVAVGFEGSRREFLEFLRTDSRFAFADSAAYVRAASEIAKRIDANIFRVFRAVPRLPYGIEAVRRSGVGGYRLGSLTEGRAGMVELYMTADHPGRSWLLPAIMLHEGVPGHHFAHAMALERSLPRFQQQGVHREFTEGWAVYAESLGRELGVYDDAYTALGGIAGSLERAIRAVLDTGIHALGWTREEAVEFALEHGPHPRPVVEDRVLQMIEHPGSLLRYKIGHWKLMELRAHAERELGDAFDVRAFHDALLENGEMPLDVLEGHMRAWVVRQAAVDG